MKYKLTDIKHRILQCENSNYEEQKNYFTSLIDRTISEPFPSWISEYYFLNEIESNAFEKCLNITNAIIPENVKYIGMNAFQECSNLESVIIPDSVISISDGAFSYCINLENVIIPNSVKSMSDSKTVFNKQIILCYKNSYAHTWAQRNNIPFALIDGTEEENTLSGSFNEFSWNLDKKTGILEINGSNTLPSDFNTIEGTWKDYKNHVLKIVYSEGFTDIGTGFSSYPLLRTVVIPDTVTSIGYYAFEGCGCLKSIAIGNNVESIGVRAFSSCKNLKSITIPDSVTYIDNYAFEDCGAKNIIISNNMANIGLGVFSNCKNLTEIIIPDKVEWIGSSAFQGCTNLTDIYLRSTTPPRLGDTDSI